jgi:hypothetical protein
VVLLALLLAPAPAAAQSAGSAVAPRNLVTRAFVIHHKDLDDVVTFIRPALSEDASVLIQSKLKTITITDQAAQVAGVARLLAEFDLPPHEVAITVNLLKASREGPGPKVGLLPGRLPPSLLELTKWLDYELLGGMSIQTTEAERSSLSLGEGYRIRFQVDLVDARSGRVRLNDFVLERSQREAGGGESYVPIFDTVVNLKSGTPYVFGATRGEDAQRALFLTVTVSIAP